MCDDEQLCSIVKEKGDDSLSYVCKNFPREFWRDVTGNTASYLSCSCPKVVEMICDLDTKVSFVMETDNSDTEDDVHILSKRNTDDLQIREMIFGFVQEAEAPLWFREFYGFYVLEKIKNDYLEGKHDALRDKLMQLYSRQYWEILYMGLQKTKPDRESQFEIMHRLVNYITEIICSISFVDKFNYWIVI